MELVQRVTRRNIWWSLAAGLACALGALPMSLVVAEGMALGAVSGALGIGMMQRRLRGLGSIPSDRLQRTIYEWMVARMGIYAVAFGLAYSLDRIRTYGLLGAVAGMLVFRTIFIGVTVVTQRRMRRQ